MPSQKAICCISFAVYQAFLFNYCTLIFPVAEELPNEHNNWKLHCAWPCQLLCTHTLYETWVNVQESKKLEWIFKNHFKQPMPIYSPLISKMELFETIINGFDQILIVSYKSIIDVAGVLYLS